MRTLVVKAKGGMGNRMLCAASGILWGRLAGRRVLVDWRDITYSNDGTNSFKRFFASPGVEDGDPTETDDLAPAIWRGNLHKSMSQMLHEFDPDKHSSTTIHRKYSIDPSRLEYPQELVVFWYYTHRMDAMMHLLRGGPYAGLSEDGVLRRVLAEEMPLAAAVRERIERFRADHWSGPMIGLHIRHTDRKTDLARYEGPVRRFLLREPEATVFLATDNRDVEARYRKIFPRVLVTPKWYPSGMQSMHQNPECPDKVENGIEALVDMYLLAACDYLVYPGGSTFSWISRLVSGLPDERVVDVERRDLKIRLKRWVRRLRA